MKHTTIEDLKQMLDDASGKDDKHKVIFKLLGTAEGFGEKEIKNVNLRPKGVVIELA